MDRVYTMELVRSLQVGEINRREFLTRATVALGSAALASTVLAACTPVTGSTEPVVLATQPPAATTQQAAPGVIAQMVSYPDGRGGALTGYVAQPAASGRYPAVVVIQEWWGLNEHIKDVASRFAAEGFVALAPDLYHGQVTSEPNEARKLVMELDMNAAVVEIQRGIDYLLSRPDVAGPRVGITGFCMGGRLTLMTALVEERLGAAVPWYGSPLTPAEAARVKAPVQGHYGNADGGIPVASVQAMGEALTAAGIPNEMHIYQGAQHAFFNDTRPSYDAEAAALAWQRTLAWLRQYLAQSS
ncbi:MAG TPA: dienelactone hydrolase family protein [Anaerolineae bacterium]|nr:dienelactone hydrolase family protein [Anaerolineae bacterium]